MERWPEDMVAAWVQASCVEQGLDVKIADPLLVRDVCALLGGAAGG